MSEPQTPHSLASRKFGLNNFDLLRILAATQVLYFHTIFHLKINAPSWSLVFQDFPGVPVFFVISGYLVSASYERSESSDALFREQVPSHLPRTVGLSRFDRDGGARVWVQFSSF